MDDLNENVYRPTESALLQGADPGQGFGRFDFSRAMSLGMDAYKEYVGLGVATTIVWFLLFIVCYFLSVVVVGLFLIPVIAIGPTLLGLYMVRRKAEFGILFKGFDAFGRVIGTAALLFLFSLPVMLVVFAPMIAAFAYLGATAESGVGHDPNLKALGVLGLSYGLVFLMIPVMYYVLGRLILVFPLVVEREYRPMQAIKTSWHVTRPYQWWLMLFFFTTQIVGQLGVYLCGVGMLFSMPLSHAFTGAAIFMLLGEDDGSLLPPKTVAPPGPAAPSAPPASKTGSGEQIDPYA